MAEFDYVAPSSLEATLQLLNTRSHPAMALAGGTQLLPDIRANCVQPTTLIDLCHLDTLKSIRLENQHIDIGARTTLAEVGQSQLIQQAFPILTEMSRSFATPLVRSTATVGGNVVSLAPIADTVVPLLALNATLSLHASGSEERSQSLASFLATHMPYASPQELVTRIRIPVPAKDTFWFYYKLGPRKAGAVSIASAALVITIQGNHIKEACIALGAIAPMPLRATRAETMLLNEALPLSDTVIERCLSSGLVTDLREARNDLWATAMYRVKMGQALVKKALKQLNTFE